MLSSTRRSSFACVTVFVSALLLAGCGGDKSSSASSTGGSGNKSGKGGRGGGAAPVLVGTVKRLKVPLVIDAVGAVEAIRTTSIRSQVTGTLQKIGIQEGQDVREGDLLFEIDARPFRNALLTAEADLQKLKVQLETARAQVTRYRQLTTDQMVSKEQFEKIADVARALEADATSAEAKVATARLQLEYCSIRAPLSGRTGNLNVHEGDLVRANDSGALVTINQLSPIYVTFGVPQQHLAALNRYRAERALPVRVVPPGTDEQPETGELTFVDNAVDSATGTIRLKATFANQRQRLWPGQFATVTLTLAEPEVLTIASSAVQTSQTGQHVYVVSGDRMAELRPVGVERSYDGLSVVTSGLKEGETVVIDGQLRVIPGRAVEIKQPAGARPESKDQRQETKRPKKTNDNKQVSGL
jgi:multidrug efflux system membrane fusion protein